MVDKHEIKTEQDLPKSGVADDILGNESKTNDKTEDPNQLFNFADSLKNNKEDADNYKKKEDVFETWVFFHLDKELFGLPVSHVQEILRVDNITHVPHAPEVVKGITNMRGKVLPVVDLRKRLGLSDGSITENSRILVVNVKDRLFGLLVDSVTQVVRISNKNIQPPPPDIMTVQSDYIIGVYHSQEAMVIMLDVEKVLYIRDKK